jgi:hypothetical protein
MIKGIATTTALSYTQVVYILKDFAGTYGKGTVGI